ncbi:energy transducer TonB [Shewanella putrefaciens]|uniref:energy transducer TonB n=1 Tax=Shewanella putrefaciens TaxID=24 RepID=UPI0018E89301|nr:energy transducer TonB [Shewanella putrefaciens]
MTPKRYLAFGVLTIAIQTGVIASQPATTLLMSDSPMTLQRVMLQKVTSQRAALQDTGINRVSVNFATAVKQATPQASVAPIAQTKPQVTAIFHAKAKAVLKPEAKPTPKPEVKTALKSESKPAPKPKTKPETKPEHKPEHMPEPVDNAANSGIKPPKELSAAATVQLADIAEVNSRSADKELTPSPVATETLITEITEALITETTETLITEITEEPPISQAAVSSAQTQSLKTPIVELAKPVFTSPPPQPTYPRIARKKGLEGTATIEVMFNELGEQLALKLVKSSGFSLLDQAALDAVETWQFEAPAPRLASHYKVRVPIRFALN